MNCGYLHITNYCIVFTISPNLIFFFFLAYLLVCFCLKNYCKLARMIMIMSLKCI